MNFHIGVDEAGTETQKMDGWSLFAVPTYRKPVFEQDVVALLEKYNLRVFHAKHAAASKTIAYEALLALIRNEIESGAAAWLSLNEPIWGTDLKDFAERVISNALTQVGITDESFRRVARSFVVPLVVIARASSEIADASEISVVLDDDLIKRDLNTSAARIKGIWLPVKRVLEIYYELYRAKTFPTAPRLVDLQVAPDETSPLVQASDVIGNFALAHLFVLKGAQSKTRLSKSAAFTSVFGDVLETNEVDQEIAVLGNDLILNRTGAATLRIA